jgi:hypothetical protein
VSATSVSDPPDRDRDTGTGFDRYTTIIHPPYQIVATARLDVRERTFGGERCQ